MHPLLCLMCLSLIACDDESRTPPPAAALPIAAPARPPRFSRFATTVDPKTVPAQAIWFLPAKCGIEDFHHVCGARGDYRYPEVCVAGCALFDYDNDGDADAYLVQSGKWPDDPDYRPMPSALMRNDGDRFTNVTEAAGTSNGSYGFGCCVGDYDNDGWLDLFVTNFDAQCVLYRNRGDGTFENVTAKVGLTIDLKQRWWASSSCFFDYDLDGWLDLYVGEYVDYTHQNNNPNCGKGITGFRDYCSPAVYNGLPDILFHNDGNGSFHDVSEAAGIMKAERKEIAKNNGKALGVVASDFTGDGWPDLYVANDQVRNFLFVNNRDGTFTEDGTLRGCAFDGSGQPLASMGVDSSDVNRDGAFDIYTSQLDAEPNSLYINDGKGFFADKTSAFRLATVDVGLVGFGLDLFDYDNDGYPDIFVTDGHVLVNVARSRGGILAFEQPDLLLHNLGGKSFEVASPTAGPHFSVKAVGRGLATGDVDLDGDLDVLITRRGDDEKRGLPDNAELLINQGGNVKNAIEIHLVADGKSSNRAAIGALVEVRTGSFRQKDELRSGTSYASQNDLNLHFGLGEATAADEIIVKWPARQFPETTLEHVPANARITIEQGKGLVKSEPFQR
ncbi:MAG: CRTAC1 family protein [Planctomycetota bacterium]